ncbi:MAG: hypothetical protein M3Q07_26855, partial [Pseudobdellovibrionaceae bacterium]|nr:hypothetical protein [Pseudobdellovibrionaceae bacterium]
MRNSLLAGIFFVSCIYCVKVGLGGIGVGGGAPPALETPETTMMLLKSSAISGDLVRYTEPGYDPIYLRPDIASIKEHSLSSVALDSGNTTVFHTPSDAEAIQAAFGRNLARSLHASMPGVLPLLSDDLTFKVKPKI